MHRRWLCRLRAHRLSLREGSRGLTNAHPPYYAVAMGVGAVGALILGRLFDLNQQATVFGGVIVAALFAPLVFLGGSAAALLGMILWGMGMALTESVLQSLVAGVVEPAKRATAFGVFDTGFGVAWFVGSALMGILYQVSIAGLVIFSVLIQLMALVFFRLAGFGHSDGSRRARAAR